MKKKDMEPLQELVRKLDSLISPMSYDDTLKRLRTEPPTKVFGRDATKCIIPWKIGQQTLQIPICNRAGMVDPRMIKLSTKLVDKMRSISPQHEEGGAIIIAKLDRMNKRYDRDVPNPPHRAAHNGQVTKFRNRLLNKIKGHLT